MLEKVSFRYPSKARAYRSTRYSFLSLRGSQVRVNCASIKITLTAYCKQRFITKDVARTLIRKRWLLVTKLGRHLWVEEICPELIDDYLNNPKTC